MGETICMTSFLTEIRKYIELEKMTLDKLDVNEINAAINLIMNTYNGKHTIYIFGNG